MGTLRPSPTDALPGDFIEKTAAQFRELGLHGPGKFDSDEGSNHGRKYPVFGRVQRSAMLAPRFQGKGLMVGADLWAAER